MVVNNWYIIMVGSVREGGGGGERKERGGNILGFEREGGSGKMPIYSLHPSQSYGMLSNERRWILGFASRHTAPLIHDMRYETEHVHVQPYIYRQGRNQSQSKIFVCYSAWFVQEGFASQFQSSNLDELARVYFMSFYVITFVSRWC